MANTFADKWNTQVYFVHIARIYTPNALTQQDKQKRCNHVILWPFSQASILPYWTPLVL